MIIEKIVVGPLETNCYILACDQTKKAVIIDPGDEYPKIRKKIEKLGLEPVCIINTHGHGDHIGANKDLGLPVWIHKLDAEFLFDPAKNLSGAFGYNISMPKADKLLAGGERFKIGTLDAEVIHTPGHTPGGISIKCDGAVFTGDTLFHNGVGRTDLPQASEDELFGSIMQKLMVLDDATHVYPGHGPDTTIGKERKHNPWIG